MILYIQGKSHFDLRQICQSSLFVYVACLQIDLGGRQRQFLYFIED